jgi:tRNA A37 N6-isopentenylltransferase MiaA
LIAGQISPAQCREQIQQATRRYAKRQLTWFRLQTSFEPLNLSHLSAVQAVEWITERASLSLLGRDD